MRKKTYWVIVLITLLILAALIFIFWQGNDSKPIDSPGSNSSTSTSEDEGDNTYPEGPDSLIPPSFKEISYTGPDTMVGRAGYFDLEFFKEDSESVIKQKQLVRVFSEAGPMTTDTGHQLYESEEDGHQYIISGYGLVRVNNGVVDDTGYLREEKTGKRIHTFANQDEYEDFLKNWESGQRILSGKTNGEKGTILIDGAMTPFKYVEENGQILFNLYEISSAICGTTSYSEDAGYITVYPNEFIAVGVPTDAANEMLRKTYRVDWDTFEFQSWLGDKFSYRAPVLDYMDMLISVEDASRMFGWRMYTDGNVLSIVSDPLNVNDKAIIYNFGGSMGYKIVFEYDENGNAYMNTYDSKGNLISSSPFDPGVDENSGGGEAPQSIPFGNSGAPQTELPEEEDALPPGWSV